jgi:uncharacterized protein
MMTTAETINARLAAIKPQLMTRYPIVRLAFFGSVARSEAGPGSDTDILVEFSKPVGFQFFELAEELEQYLQAPVDLVSRQGIKPAYFAAIEPDLIHV